MSKTLPPINSLSRGRDGHIINARVPPLFRMSMPHGEGHGHHTQYAMTVPVMRPPLCSRCDADIEFSLGPVRERYLPPYNDLEDPHLAQYWARREIIIRELAERRRELRRQRRREQRRRELERRRFEKRRQHELQELSVKKRPLSLQRTENGNYVYEERPPHTKIRKPHPPAASTPSKNSNRPTQWRHKIAVDHSAASMSTKKTSKSPELIESFDPSPHRHERNKQTVPETKIVMKKKQKNTDFSRNSSLLGDNLVPGTKKTKDFVKKKPIIKTDTKHHSPKNSYHSSASSSSSLIKAYPQEEKQKKKKEHDKKKKNDEKFEISSNEDALVKPLASAAAAAPVQAPVIHEEKKAQKDEYEDDYDEISSDGEKPAKPLTAVAAAAPVQAPVVHEEKKAQKDEYEDDYDEISSDGEKPAKPLTAVAAAAPVQAPVVHEEKKAQRDEYKKEEYKDDYDEM